MIWETNALWLALGLATNGIIATNNFVATNTMGQFWGNACVTSGWNFVEDAKHLTPEEKQRFNDKANSMRRIPFASIEMVVGEVKALDILRSMQELQSTLSNTVNSIHGSLSTNEVYLLEHKLMYAKQLRDGKFLGASLDVLTEVVSALVSMRPLTTEWVGHPMISDNAPYTPSQGWLSNIEMGLRSDGVVVWRKKDK